jgi:hypothetical protein
MNDIASPAEHLEREDLARRPIGEFGAIRSAYLTQPLSSAVRAGMLGYLVRAKGIRSSGSQGPRRARGHRLQHRDRRCGAPRAAHLIVDPDTGKVLGEEVVLTKGADKLNVPVPSVISYTMFLSAEYTDALR